MPYIGLDVGTSGCKASVVDMQGNVLQHRRCEYAPVSPHAGYIEMDARLVWQAVQQVLKAVARPDITALAIASFGEAVVLLDENDEVLANSIYYSDVRGTAEVADFLQAIEPEQARKITGTQANPMYSACKLLWIKKNQPEVYAKAKKIMLFGDYIGYMLTGKRVIDYSLASRTMLFDVQKMQWSPYVCGALKIEENMFSVPVRSGSIIGPLLPVIAGQLGLPQSALLVAGGHDQVLATLGGGAVAQGDSVDGMGSSECISLVLNGQDWTPEMAEHNFCCEPYVFENTYLTLAFNASSGTSMRWYRDCIEKERKEEYESRGESLYKQMDMECPAGPTNLLFLPHVGGSGTPYLDSSMGGAVVGLRVNTTKQEIFKAVMEGVCFEMQWNVELLQKCKLNLREITAVGGGANSAVMMQIKADVMNRRIQILQESETGTMGLALLCAYAMGDIKDLALAAKSLAKKAAQYTPNPQNAKIYAQKMGQYRRVYPAMKTIYADENKTGG